MPYQYWTIRYVPSIARGEFTNIGIVCGMEAGDWAVRFDTRSIPTHGGLRSDLQELGTWARWFERRIAAHRDLSIDGDTVSVGWIEHLRTRQANSIQFSPSSPIDGASASAVLDLLFPLLVERDTPRRAPRGRSRAALRNRVRETLQFERGFAPGRNLFSRPLVQVGKQRGSFDLARDEGADTVLTNAWTFNVATLDDLERDVQSWNYLVARFRAGGAEVTLGSRNRRLAGQEPIEVVFDRPTERHEVSWRSDIFEAAREAWQINDIRATEFDTYVAELRDTGPTVSLTRQGP